MTDWQSWTAIFFVDQAAGVLIANGVYRKVSARKTPIVASIVYWTFIMFMLAVCSCLFSSIYMYLRATMHYHEIFDPIVVVSIMLLSVNLGVKLKRDRAVG